MIGRPSGSTVDSMDITDRMRSLVDSLCSADTAGRAPGSAEGIAARTVVHEQFFHLELKPMGEDRYVQPISPIGGANLIGAIPGSTDRWIVLGAHYDHIGRDLDVYWGADDNASGVAVMLEVARALTGTPGERGVLLCAFDAEEPPFFLTEIMGSQWWVDSPTVPLDAVDLMVCLDVVGHRLGDDSAPDEVGESVFVLGAELTPGLTGLFTDTEPVPGLRPRQLADWVVPPLSDYHAFREAGIPYLFYTCGRNRHYHQWSDLPEHLDYDKMAALAGHLSDMITAARGAEIGPRAAAGADLSTLDSLEAVVGLIDLHELPHDLATDLIESVRAASSNGNIAEEDRIRVTLLLLEVENVLA